MAQQARQFVVQQHHTPDGTHWDLMLEMDGCLQTYRLDKHPCEIGSEPVNAEKIFDHPMKFLTYEGPVNNNTGKVQLVDVGGYEITSQKPDRIELVFDGRILKGKFSLVTIDENRRHLSMLQSQ
jgi:hypothetical protein